MKTFKVLLAAGIVFTLAGISAGCSGTGTGGNNGGGTSPSLANGLDLPPGTNALLSVRVATPSAGALTLETSAGTAEITTALMGLKEIELETAESADDSEIDLEGPFIVDLNTGTVENLGSSRIDDDADDDGVEDADDDDDDGDGTEDSSDADDDDDGVADSDDSVMDETEIFDALELPTGVYTEIKAKLDRIDLEDGIDPASPLAGNSLFIEGTLAGQPFRVIADFDEEFEIENSAGITVDNTSIASFILTFNPAAWFDGVDLSAADQDAEGVVVLDDTHNTDLFEQFRDNVKASANIENDEDGDGVEDDDDSEDDSNDDSDDDSDDSADDDS